MTKLAKKQRRDNVAKYAEDASNKGHYLDRLKNIAIAIEDRESELAVMALEQIHVYASCRPQGSDGIQWEISIRLMNHCKNHWKFTQEQLSKLWYGVHYSSREVFDLKFPYEDSSTNQMKSNTTRGE